MLSADQGKDSPNISSTIDPDKTRLPFVLRLPLVLHWLQRYLENHPDDRDVVLKAVTVPKLISTPASTPSNTDIPGEPAPAPIRSQFIEQEVESNSDRDADQHASPFVKPHDQSSRAVDNHDESLFVDPHDHGSPASQQGGGHGVPPYQAHVEDAKDSSGDSQPSANLDDLLLTSDGDALQDDETRGQRLDISDAGQDSGFVASLATSPTTPTTPEKACSSRQAPTEDNPLAERDVAFAVLPAHLRANSQMIGYTDVLFPETITCGGKQQNREKGKKLSKKENGPRKKAKGKLEYWLKSGGFACDDGPTLWDWHYTSASNEADLTRIPRPPAPQGGFIHPLTMDQQVDIAVGEQFCSQNGDLPVKPLGHYEGQLSHRYLANTSRVCRDVPMVYLCQGCYSRNGEKVNRFASLSASMRVTRSLRGYTIGEEGADNAVCFCRMQMSMLTDMGNEATNTPDLCVGNKYRIGRKIGSGSFGEIYLGKNIISGEEVAIKLESAKAERPQLKHEARVYKSLAGGVGVPYVRWFGTECDYNAMVLDLLGPSLEDLFNFCNRKFSLKTVLLLADQLISRIAYIHSKSVIHRDIKPENVLMGAGKRGNLVNIIDFGLAKKYRDPRTHSHIPYRENRNLTGTARYASVNTHIGVDQSRRDDMESLGYVMLYFCRGSLPWQGLKAATAKQKYDGVMFKKMTTRTEVLCHGLPNEFAIYLNYTRSLRFDAKPDYVYLRKIFRDLFVREGFEYDYVFDWTVQIPEECIGQCPLLEPFPDFRYDAAKRTKNGEMSKAVNLQQAPFPRVIQR
ncbi:hypothetical protein V494_00229 [Pseudogymnoascus sp. VKM F-4513 (FW-928)]|nr:hypothetical protein V494_00229 [Pseudogymnoascus sp. VKM F-4513 (FW-928)]